MKEILKQLAAHNTWANQRLFDLILSLPEEIQLKQFPSSFQSLHLTILHMLDAESIWWQRMKLSERIIRPSEQYKDAKLAEICQYLLSQNRQWEDWIANAMDHSIDHVFSYYNSRKEHFKTPVYQMLLHVFNHDTYHRGQLVTMLRQGGIEKIPATDFIVWTRGQGKVRL